MKDFLKYTLATITGIVVVSIIVSVFSMLTLAGLMSMDGTTTSIDDNSVMVIKLDGAIADRSAEANPMDQLLGETDGTTGLNDIIKALKYAKEDDNIKGVYIESGSLDGASPALLQELRNALVDFKSSDKFIVSYGDSYSQGAYYVSSVADSVIINPQGMVEWVGMAVQTMYYKKILEKVGVNVQVVKVGTYKSAVEPFMLDDISDANREQIETFSSEIWGEMLADVSKSRNMTVKQLNAFTDKGLVLMSTEELVAHKIVDRTAYVDEVPQIIANMMGVEKGEYKTTSVKNVAAQSVKPKSMSGDIVAVYYAEGSIVESASKNLFSNAEEIVGNKVASDLKSLAEDEDVKAVVLRVNSPGGSAYASEQIWRQVMNIKSKKPIVVSMGDYAASGGYYISCAADWIIAQPTTLTGSIGIFGTFPEVSELVKEKIGVNVAVVKTNEFADLGTMMRPFTPQEAELFQTYINRGYDLFTRRCADGRSVPQDSIKAIGEGRVWTGLHAKQIGLVDQLGSLDDAIAKAKELAEIDDCTVAEYPAQSSFFEKLMEDKMSGSSYADEQLRNTLGEYYEAIRVVRSATDKAHVQAAMPYYLRFNL